jgi:hypothetical protein
MVPPPGPMEVVHVTRDGDCSIALDIYLRTISGRSLAEALAAGHLDDPLFEVAVERPTSTQLEPERH